jgi:LemA protein
MDINSYIFWGVLIAVVVFIISIYNRLVMLKNRYENAFVQIDIQLKRRYELIPNLVEIAKAYMTHERETLESVISARNTALEGLNSAKQNLNEATINNLSQTENMLQGAMGRFQMVMEDYPELKANENMMQLFEELTSTENKISFARQGYNDSVTDYNIYRQSFPTIVLARNFGHPQDADLLEFEERDQLHVAPKVQF